MKFYYNLSYNLLPSYFNYYLEVINNAFPCQYELRQIARPLIRPQRTRLVFTESKCFISIDTVIKLHTHTLSRNIRKHVQYKTHTYHGFSYNVKEKYLGTYKYECSNLICYKCGRYVKKLVSQTTVLLIESRLLLYSISLSRNIIYVFNVVSSVFSSYMTGCTIMCVRMYECIPIRMRNVHMHLLVSYLITE